MTARAVSMQAAEESALSEPAPADVPWEEVRPIPVADVVRLEQVVESVYRAYPLLEAAYYSRKIARGDHLAAQGAFDTKLNAASENGPLGFYETYRHRVGIEQPTYCGGTLFGGYRIGRGSFQPWYLERETNDGGELTMGIAVPLVRNVAIDERRAALWRTDEGRRLVEAEIRLQRIEFVRAATYAYWDWVAAGRRYRISQSLLRLADDRNDAIRRKVETGDAEPPVLQDNRRLIVSRDAKVIEAQRKLQQAAIKLSLFLRDEQGQPLIAEPRQLGDFPAPLPPEENLCEIAVEAALASRPELRVLNSIRRQLEIDLAQARNELLPEVEAVALGSQDTGGAASAKKDKSEFELEAGVFVDVPFQRRRARGKIAATESKLNQLAARARMTRQNIIADVQQVCAAMLASQQQLERARESVTLADRLAEIERRRFELGEGDLLSLNLREQQAAEAQGAEVDALYEFFTAMADYFAVLALEAPR